MNTQLRARSFNEEHFREPALIPLRNYKEKLFNEKLILHQQGEILLIDLEEIAYCRAHGSYTGIILKCGKNILSAQCLKHVLGQIEHAGFVRIHQSYVVPAGAICSIRKDEIVLKTGLRIPMSKRYRGDIMTLIRR